MYELETLFALLLQLFPLQEMTVQTGLIQEVLNLQHSKSIILFILDITQQTELSLDSLAFHSLEDMVISLRLQQTKDIVLYLLSQMLQAQTTTKI